MKNARPGGEPRMSRKEGPDRPLVAVEEKLDVRTAFERNRGGGHDDRWPVIAPHRVQRYANIARHSLGPTARAALPGRRGAARQ